MVSQDNLHIIDMYANRVLEQYSEYFYVNLYTKKSQWEKPTEPVYPPSEVPPGGPPPAFAGDSSRLGSNNPYASSTTPGRSSNDISEDERLARRLQEEEDQRARLHPGQPSAGAYYNQGSTVPEMGQQDASNSNLGSPLPNPQSKGGHHKGLLGKLLDKASSKAQSRPHGAGYAPQQHGYGVPYNQPGHGGYYGGQPMYGAPGRRPGMGAGGAAALGLGGGLLGGAMLANAADAGDHGGYVENNYYGDDGGDMGDGGDYGGGDF
jgi:hypothetical protein